MQQGPDSFRGVTLDKGPMQCARVERVAAITRFPLPVMYDGRRGTPRPPVGRCGAVYISKLF